jgi:hypothetical protein
MGFCQSQRANQAAQQEQRYSGWRYSERSLHDVVIRGKKFRVASVTGLGNLRVNFAY